MEKIMNRHDLITTHEEADVIIVQQCYHLAKEGFDELRIEVWNHLRKEET